MNWADKYISYISTQKRYSARTVRVYTDVLAEFYLFANLEPGSLEPLSTNELRGFQVFLMDKKKLTPRTVNLHLSVLSGYCRYLVKQGALKANPVSLLTRPKQSKRLPSFYKQEAINRYLQADNALRRRDFDLQLGTEQERKDTYQLCLQRIIVCILYSTGIRRAELIGLRRSDVDFSRKELRVRGKGDKTREIPIILSLIEEISLYLQSVERLIQGAPCEKDSPLLVTYSGSGLYPVLVDRAVKAELGAMERDFPGKKSPHVLRHTLATDLLEQGADLNSIKEVLGHANLAATQVYTHSSARQLKKIYEQAHPRAHEAGEKATKNGGNYGN